MYAINLTAEQLLNELTARYNDARKKISMQQCQYLAA